MRLQSVRGVRIDLSAARLVMHELFLSFPKLRAAVIGIGIPLRRWLDENPKVRKSAVSIGLVAGVHLLALFILLGALQSPAPDSSDAEMHMTLSPLAAPSAFTPELQALPPAAMEVPLPVIRIADEASPNAVASAVADTQVIAPRPDPSHPNDWPDSGGAGHAAEVVLRILVLTDGSIGDSSIAQSSGTADLDALALSFARAHWRYLPATLAGRAIQAWTTVIVRFR